MKKIYSLILFFMIILSCKSINNIKEVTKNNYIKNNDYKEKYELDLLKFNYFINLNESKIKNNSIYEVKYEINFKFINNNDNFKVYYTLFDENDKKIFQKDNKKPIKDFNENNVYIIKDYFNDIISYSKIKYLLIVENDNNKKEFKGEYEDISIPKLKNVKIGPIISKYINEKLNVSLSINFIITNCKDIKWIHFIPPSLKSYWNIPWEINDNEITVNRVVYEENKNFIENGKYVIQINLDKYGIIQKDIEIIDLYGNTSGENYGLTIINVEKIDKKKIKLESLLFDKIEYLELWFFDNNNYESKKIGFAKIIVQDEIYFDYLITQIKDNDGNKIKIEYNKEYQFKIYSYSKEINGINYISISDFYTFKLSRFNFFQLFSNP